MKLHPDSARGQYSITACGDGHVEINGRRFTHSLVVGPRHLDENWPVAGFDALDAASLKPLAAIPCDVVLLGTGRRQHFPAPALLQPFMAARIGVEVMDTAAACRTYNILIGEGRAPLAALIIE